MWISTNLSLNYIFFFLISFMHAKFQKYKGSVWIEIIVAENWKLKTENWKHCSKIIFKCVNSIVGPIFNIFLIHEQCINSAKQYMNSAKQCVNSEPMWGYCSRAVKKKKKAENVDAAKRQETRKPNTHKKPIIILSIKYLNFKFL